MSRKKAFWLSLAATLAVILPLYLIVMAARLLTPTAVQNTKTDVPLASAGVGDYKNFLLVTENPEPVFALMRFDAVQNAVNIAFIMPETVLLQNGAPVTAAEAFSEAGPAALAQNLTETFSVRVDNYMKISADELVLCTSALGSVNMDMSRLGVIKDLTTLKKFAYNGGEGDITTASARVILQQSDAEAHAKQTARANIYRSFFQSENADIYECCRRILSADGILCNINAVEKEEYLRIFSFLQREDITVKCSVMPAYYENGQYLLNSDSVLLCEEYFM